MLSCQAAAAAAVGSNDTMPRPRGRA